MESESCVGLWIDQLKAGNQEAARRIWDRHFADMVRLAQKKLHGRLGQLAEDVAVSAMESFFEGVQNNEFPKLVDRGDLWGLLSVITERKAKDYRVREDAAKRGGGKVRGESWWQVPGADSPGGIEQAAERKPGVEDEVQAGELLARLLEKLPASATDQHRTIACLKLEGWEDREIADKTGFSLRTVERRLQQIREIWLRVVSNEQ
jgi:DNA-directed RNA polymerase specialized sigma24 family protein